MFRKISTFVLALVMVLTLTIGGTAQAASKITVAVDGISVSTDIAPVASGSNVLVSTQTVSYAIGADVSYSSSKKQATIKTVANTFVFTMGKTAYTLNGASKTAAVAPKLVSKKPMVPIKEIMDGIGGSYSFSGKKVTLKYFSMMDGTIKISGSTTVQPIADEASKKLMKLSSKVSITVSGGGSGAGIKDVAEGNVNLGNSSRELTDEEKGKIKGIYTIARDGIAIIVNPKNKVKKLTHQQAADIFLGNITNWNQVGGANAPIIVMTRETASGTLSTLQELLLEKKSVVATATPNNSSALMRQAVAGNKNAIGFDSIGFLNKTVKAVALDNVLPTAGNVKNGSYMMGRKLFTLSKDKAAGVYATYLDFLKTKYCQSKIVAKEGYIAIK